MQVSSLCSPETKSRALRPARSMVRAAISTDRSRTAPTMAASSSGGCKEEAPGAEGRQPAVPPRPTAPAKALQGPAPGSAALCQAVSLATQPGPWGLRRQGRNCCAHHQAQGWHRIRASQQLVEPCCRSSSDLISL